MGAALFGWGLGSTKAIALVHPLLGVGTGPADGSLAAASPGEPLPEDTPRILRTTVLGTLGLEDHLMPVLDAVARALRQDRAHLGAALGAIALSPAGSPIVGGWYAQTIDFGTGTLPATPQDGGEAFFLAELGP